MRDKVKSQLIFISPDSSLTCFLKIQRKPKRLIVGVAKLLTPAMKALVCFFWYEPNRRPVEMPVQVLCLHHLNQILKRTSGKAGVDPAGIADIF